MNEAFPLEPLTLPHVRRFYSARQTTKAFPFEEVMDDNCVKPETQGIVQEWTLQYYQGLLDQATENYHQRNFQAAIALLNEAIRINADPPLGAFNIRAATFIKLGNLTDALTDAGRMIRRYPDHSTGYLRLAQILKMQGKATDALRIYERGLLQVPPTEDQFQVIQDSRDKLSSILAPKKLLDPLEHLPKELALDFMGYFAFKDVVRASQVCRSWRTFTFSHPSFWSQLDLTTGKRSPSFTTVRAYLQRSKRQLSSISLPKDSSDASQQGRILDYISHSPQPYDRLEEVIIGADSAKTAVTSLLFPAKNLRKFEASSNINVDCETAFELLNKFPVLESAVFGSSTGFAYLRAGPRPIRIFDTLRRLHVSFVAGNLSQALLDEHLIERIPNIQTLSLEKFRYVRLVANRKGLSELHQLEMLRLWDSSIFGNLNLPASLKSISLERSICEDIPSAPQGVHLPELKTINLGRYIHKSGSMNIRTFLGSCSGNLGYLSLNYMSTEMHYIPDVFREEVLRKVEGLGLAELPVNDDNLAYIATVATRLRKIDLSSTRVSGVGVKALVNGCKDTLVWIKLDNCRNVSGDAIEWARSCGIEVSYYFRDSLAGRIIR